MKRTSILALSACVVVLVLSLPAHADLTSWLGLDRIAQKAGADAGAKAANAIIEASRNAALMTNQFGILVDEYYSDDPKKREHAKKIIWATFPELPKDSERIALEVTVDFRNIDTTKNPFTSDIWFIDSNDVNRFSDRVLSGVRYKGESISSHPTTTFSEIERIRLEVRKQLTNYITPPNLYKDASRCGQSRSIDQRCVNQYKRQAESRAIEAAIMALVVNKVDIESTSRVTRDWSGGKYAVILIPTAQLNAQPNAEMYLSFHVAGNSLLGVRDFKTPKKLSMPLMRKMKPLPSNDPLHPLFSYEVVDLRIDKNL